jgi:hypothetical protein
MAYGYCREMPDFFRSFVFEAILDSSAPSPEWVRVERSSVRGQALLNPAH